MSPLLIAAGIGYILGALPFGYVIARAHGVNIFEVGSKNPGATNVLRVLGKGPGYLAFALDAVKGILATGWPLWFIAPESITSAQIVGLVAAIIGHSFSCFTRFKGGKGVATVAGAFLVMSPWAVLVGFLCWVATFYTTRYVSLASIVAAIALPVSSALLHQPWPVIAMISMIAVFVIYRHRGNIVRLCKGTEYKFVRKNAEAK